MNRHAINKPRFSWINCQVISLLLGIFTIVFFLSCTEDDPNSAPIGKVQDVAWDGDPKTIPSAMNRINQAAHPEATKGGRFFIYSHQFPKSLNYYLEQFTTTARIFTSLYEPLTSYHPITLETMPHLARDWKISADKKKFTFYIDGNAKWSDGKPVTAEDVLFTYDTIMDKNNATAVFRIGLSRFKKPKIIDSLTIEFEVTDIHWNNFNEIASSLFILPKHYFEGKDFNKENFEFDVVSGPYKMLESKKNRYVKLERRGDWWARGYPFQKNRYNFDQIIYKVYSEESIALQAFKKGDIDMFPVYTASVWAEQTKGESFDNKYIAKQRIFNKKPIGFQGWAMNMRRDIFKDVRVRKAIAHLVDRNIMIEKLAYNQYAPTNSYFPDFYLLGTKNPNQPVDFDIEEARRLLKEAGWEPNSKGLLEKDGKEFKFTILDRDKRSEKYFTVFLEKARYVGIDARIDTTDLAAWSAKVDKYDFDMTWASWGSGIFKDPESQWFSKYADEEGQPNLAGYKNSAADEIIIKQKTEFDLNKRNAMLKQLDQIIYKEYPYVLLWHVDNTRLLYWRKFGMPENPLGKYGDESFASDYWFLDEKKSKQLQESIQSGKPMDSYSDSIKWNE
ncbi:extracellular solute-binding protein [Leptospira sp. GIMC2001]|uniref:extracellular solute-binding protein n=1 Tax=Leptospira sp. GIMC2001 TaxID=1513297 RepID=UPI00234A8A9E|nr:extracellular solute-binding protein [Leptospira sp. GIMC2001]WCL48639.1 extracellular solute-binding protein [Leptospira sp. GIMC2001]